MIPSDPEYILSMKEDQGDEGNDEDEDNEDKDDGFGLDGSTASNLHIC